MAIDNSNMSRLFSSAGSQQPRQATGYTNLGRLMGASKDNALGQKVAGGVQQQLGGVQQQLGEQQKQFQEESDKNKLGNEKDVQDREAVLGRFSNASGSEAATGPSDDELKQFEKFRGGQYAGPSGLADTSAIKSTAQQLQQQASNLTPSGTQELLRRSVGGDRYTQGQQRLDSLLLDRSALTPIARQASGIGQQISQVEQAAQGQAQLNRNLAQQFGQETQNKLNTAMTGIDTAVQGQLKSAQEAEKQRQNNIQNIIYSATGKKPKLDESGNPVIDPSTGKVVTETGPSMSNSERTATIQKQLLDAGIDPEQIKSIFGEGNTVSKMDTAKNAAIQKLAQGYASINGSNPGDYWNQYWANQRIGGVLDTPIQRNYYGLSNEFNDLANSSKLGSAYKSGTIQDLLNRVAQSVQARSGSEQGIPSDISEQTVANAQQRSNYEALNKLLGGATAKYNANAPQYKAGRILINPEQI